ncbi:MAG TPA: sulfotransferase [Alphaproteobacteria bacterium]|nr:sulfotransferase [Alphaproteobacteria bacterium]
MASKPTARAGAPDLSIAEALSRAHAHWNAGQADQAELFCQRILAAWPGQADALHLMGVMAHAYGNRDLAIQHLRQACQAPRAPAVYFSNLAEMCRQQGLLAEAERAGRRAVALDPNLVAAWNNLGIILQEAGQLEESLACLERVVALEPDNAEAHNNLGNTCKRMGRLEQAETFYKRALALNPDYAEAHSNLAHLLNDRGRFDEAAASARRAIDLSPQLADAYINLAGVETSRQRWTECLRWLDMLLAFAPLHAGGLAARAVALKHLDRLDEALDSVKRALAASPERAESHDTLGQVLQALDRVDEALASFDRAAALPGLAAESALVNRGVLFTEIGRQDEARAAFERAIEAFPHSVKAHASRADLVTFAPGDPRIAQMDALLRGEVSHGDRTALHFALAKAYLDIGDSDRAFGHLHEGNRLKRSTFTYDAEATSRWMKSIAAVFTPALLARLAGAGGNSALPVFIVGMPRSGTTLIEQILASHPLVHGAGELSILQRIVDGLGEYPAAVERLTRDDFGRMGRAYLARVEKLAGGKRHVVDKMPANFLRAGLIRLILPDARIIHCRRDPADTCLSCYSRLFEGEQAFAYDQVELGRFHRDYQGLMAHWRAVLPADRLLDVDYEAVVDDLEGQARRLVEFLGLPWDAACLRFHETRRAVRTASVNQIRQPVYTTSKHRWRKHARHLGPLLEALGISADGP